MKSNEVKTGWSKEKSGRLFYGKLWLKADCYDPDDDDDNCDNM